MPVAERWSGCVFWVEEDATQSPRKIRVKGDDKEREFRCYSPPATITRLWSRMITIEGGSVFLGSVQIGSMVDADSFRFTVKEVQ